MSFLHLEIGLRESKILFILSMVLYVLAVSVLFVIQVLIWVKLTLLLLIIFSGYQVCWRTILLHKPQSVTRIFFSKGYWQILNRAGECTAVSLLGKSYLSAWFVILHFCDVESRRHHSIVLARDSIDRQAFRRLQVVLRTAF